MIKCIESLVERTETLEQGFKNLETTAARLTGLEESTRGLEAKINNENHRVSAIERETQRKHTHGPTA